MACELKMSADGKFHLYMLDRMTKQRQFFDARIIMRQSVGERTSLVKIVEAHKCVLAASGYFFYSKFKRNDTNKIDFDLGKEFWTAEDLTAVIEFLYTGSITLCLDNILNVTYLARLFGISILENLCDKYATFFLSETTFLPLYIALLSNDKAISVSQKMMLHRDRLGEFVQTVFFSQLIENEQLKKLTSQQMLLLLRNVVFCDMRNQDVIPVIKLAVNWPLSHNKDADSVKVTEVMIKTALNIRLSDLNHVQRVEVEKLLQGTEENARLYYEICGAKLAVQFESYIQKAIDFVFGDIDENEFNKDTNVEERTCKTADEDDEDLPVQSPTENRDKVGMVIPENTERNVDTNSHVIYPTFLIKTESVGNSSDENEDKLDDIKRPSEVGDASDQIGKTGKPGDADDVMDAPGEVGNANDVIGAPGKLSEASDVIGKAGGQSESGDVSAAAVENDTESGFQIKIEVDIDSDEYTPDTGKYSVHQTELLLDTMKNNPHSYYASDLMSGIARQLSMNSMVMNVDKNHVSTDGNILSEIYKKRKREHSDDMCSKRTRSKLLNKISSYKNDLAGTSDRLAVSDQPNDLRHCRKERTPDTNKLDNSYSEKDKRNTSYHSLQEKDGSNSVMCGEGSDDETLSAAESQKDISDTESDFESTEVTNTERTEVTNTESTEEGEENNFYEYVLDQISHNIEENTCT